MYPFMFLTNVDFMLVALDIGVHGVFLLTFCINMLMLVLKLSFLVVCLVACDLGF